MGLPALQIEERLTDAVIVKIKAEIEAQLADVRLDRTDPAAMRVNVEKPASYLIFASDFGLRTPAIFVVIDGQDVDSDSGSNYFATEIRLRVAALVEDRDKDLLTRKAWRYAAALIAVLHQCSLTVADASSNIVSKTFLIVEGVDYSGEYTESKTPDAPEAVFRKEVVLKIRASHHENLKQT